MKNDVNNNLNLTVGRTLSEDSNFSDKLEILKNKVIDLRKINTDYFKSEKEVNTLAKEFIEEFKDNKAELGKVVTWLGDTISPEELVSIIGNSINNKDLSRLSLMLESRLCHNYKEPASYMNTHISNLVEVLNTYDNYIESFDSIEVPDDSNCLDRNKYLIDHDLHNLLLNGYKLNRNRDIDVNEPGIYMVVFKVVKVKGEDTLVYKYIKYPYIFHDTIYSYILKESSSLVITNDKSVGVDYMFVMQYFFETKDELVSEINSISSQFKYKTMYNNTRGIYPRNIVDLCKMLLQGCPIFLNQTDICNLISLAWQRKVYEAVVKFIQLYDFYKDEKEGLTMIQERLKKPNLEKYNLLGRLIFVTDDLNSLLKEIRKDYNPSVNAGIQKWRGQSDSLSHTIDSIDTDFRKSLNRHNQYHVNVGNIPKNSLIGRSKFSYQNIHLNIGNVRWYSNKTFVKPTLKEDFRIFNEIGNFIKSSPVNKDTQLKIETALQDYSYINLNEKKSKGEEFVINYSLVNRKFTSLLFEERPKLIDYISRARSVEFKTEPTIVNDLIQHLLSSVLKELKDDYIVSVIYGRLFKIVNNHFINQENNRGIETFVDIGNDLVSNYFYTLFKKRKADFGDRIFKLSDWKEENELLVSKFDSTIKAEIGGKMVGLLKNLDLVQFKIVVKGLKEKINVIVPTSRILEVVDNNSVVKPLPRRLPMIVKPQNYHRVGGKEMLGGYLLNNEKYMDPLIIHKWNFKKPTLIKDDNLVYDLVNNINSVGFKINKDVLNFINTYGSRYNLLISPSYEHPLTKKNKLTKAEFVELSSFLSKRNLQDNILSIAEIYSNVHEFFIPTRLDFRGRLYCISEYLNYQSTELAKSLLLFSKSEKLFKYDKTGIDYLKAYGANCFGNKLDKMSWKSRSKWVDDNLDKIISFRDGVLIEKAENKLLFISFCFEYNRFLETFNNDKEYFETCLPIQLDATCNGYQHLALLSLDHDLAKELNLTKSNHDDTPKDFYNFIGIKLVNYFRDQLNNNKTLSVEERDVYSRFSNIVVARKMIKKVIMTKVYNVTYFKMVDYLKDHFEVIDSSDKANLKYCFKDDPSLVLMEKDFHILVKGLITVMVEDNSKLEKLLKYLHKVVEITNELNLPLNWGTPESGVDIEQSYVKSKKERLKVFSYIKKYFNISIADTDNYNKSKQTTAFLPNFIHSLDAASLALLVHYYFTNGSMTERNIYTIHDCFAVTANNVKNLQLYLSSVYQKIYTEKSYLREFHKNTISNIEYTCNKETHYEGDTFKIKIKGGNKPKYLTFPSVEEVFGPNCNKDYFIKDSSYLTN